MHQLGEGVEKPVGKSIHSRALTNCVEFLGKLIGGGNNSWLFADCTSCDTSSRVCRVSNNNSSACDSTLHTLPSPHQCRSFTIKISRIGISDFKSLLSSKMLPSHEKSCLDKICKAEWR